jgi:hypothetical protein
MFEYVRACHRGSENATTHAYATPSQPAAGKSIARATKVRTLHQLRARETAFGQRKREQGPFRAVSPRRPVID